VLFLLMRTSSLAMSLVSSLILKMRCGVLSWVMVACQVALSAGEATGTLGLRALNLGLVEPQSES